MPRLRPSYRVANSQSTLPSLPLYYSSCTFILQFPEGISCTSLFQYSDTSCDTVENKCPRSAKEVTLSSSDLGNITLAAFTCLSGPHTSVGWKWSSRVKRLRIFIFRSQTSTRDCVRLRTGGPSARPASPRASFRSPLERRFPRPAQVKVPH